MNRKKNGMNANLLIVMAMLMLAGCAPQSYVIQDGARPQGENPIEIAVRPHESLGVKVTPNLLAGDVLVLEAALTDKVLGEEFPGRIRWNGWLFDPTTKKEYFVQILRYSMDPVTGDYVYAFMVDGAKRTMISPKSKMIFLGSMGILGANLSADTFAVDLQEFCSKAEYRKKIILEKGSEIGNLIPNKKLLKEILADNKEERWNLYDIPEGQIYSPFGEDFVERIIRINPSYGLMEKIKAKGCITISHPVTTVASILLSVIEGMNAPSEGWDYLSVLPSRAMMAAIIESAGLPRKQLIIRLNEEIAMLREENTKLKK